MYLYRSFLMPSILCFTLFSITFAITKTPICILIHSNELLKDEIISIENRLTNYAIHSEKYKVIERRSLQTIFQEQEFQLSDYVNNSMIKDIGNIISVSQILTGDISITNNLYNINLKIHDVKTGEVLRSTNRLILFDYVTLLNSIPDIAKELFGEIKNNNNILSIPSRSFRINKSACNLADVEHLDLQGGDFLSLHSVNNYIISSQKDGKVYKLFFGNSINSEIVFDYPEWTFTTSGHFSDDDMYYAIGGDNGSIYIWETEFWGNPYQLQHNLIKITSLLFIKDDTFLVAGNARGELILWDYLSQKVVFSKKIKNIAIENIIALSDNEGFIIQHTDGTFGLFSTNSFKIEISSHTMDKISSDILVDYNKNAMIYGTHENRLVYRNLPSYTHSYFLNDNWIVPNIDIGKKINFTNNIICSIAISEYNDIMALGTENGELIVIDLIDNSECARTEISNISSIQKLAFLNNEIIVGLSDNSIHRIVYD